MAYLVKVTGVAHVIEFFAEKYDGSPQGAGGTRFRHDAHEFSYHQALGVATQIQRAVGKKAVVEVEPT